MSDNTIDVNDDGVVDVLDDINKDGVIDEMDVAALKVYDNANPDASKDPEKDEAAAYLKRYGVVAGPIDPNTKKPTPFVPPTREIPLSTYLDEPYSKTTLYGGPSLLDPENRPRGMDIGGNLLPPGVYQELYDLSVDPVKLLQELDFDSRKELTDFLYAKGLYGGQKPSATRFDKNEIEAVHRLLRLSNQVGRTYDWTISWIASNLKTVYGGPKIGAVTPFENREKVLDTEAVSILGRKLTNADLREAAEMIAQRERNNDKTNLSVMAEKAVSKQNPELESANRFAKGVDIFRSMLGGG